MKNQGLSLHRVQSLSLLMNEKYLVRAKVRHFPLKEPRDFLSTGPARLYFQLALGFVYAAWRKSLFVLMRKIPRLRALRFFGDAGFPQLVSLVNLQLHLISRKTLRAGLEV